MVGIDAGVLGYTKEDMEEPRRVDGSKPRRIWCLCGDGGTVPPPLIGPYGHGSVKPLLMIELEGAELVLC